MLPETYFGLYGTFLPHFVHSLVELKATLVRRFRCVLINSQSPEKNVRVYTGWNHHQRPPNTWCVTCDFEIIQSGFQNHRNLPHIATDVTTWPIHYPSCWRVWYPKWRQYTSMCSIHGDQTNTYPTQINIPRVLTDLWLRGELPYAWDHTHVLIPLRADQ